MGLFFPRGRQLKRQDFYVLFFIRPPFMLLIAYWLFGSDYFGHWPIFWPITLALIVQTIVSWRLHIYADGLVRRRYANIEKVTERLVWSMGCHICIMAAVISLGCALFALTEFQNFDFRWDGYFRALVTGFCTNIAATGFHEGVYMFHNWRRTWLEAEELKKNNLRSQLTGLKSKVDSHFLFNSINTLSSLIEEDRILAEKFLDEMSKVYRYLLQGDREELIPLEEEIAFIDSWFFLLKTRYGPAIDMQLEQLGDTQAYALPVLSLMLVAENIIEHNSIGKKAPLKLCLRREGDNLLFGHLMQPKKNSNVANEDQKIQHLFDKYKLMGIYEANLFYREGWRWIRIPLILTRTPL
jgi:hypothetical protein